MVVNVLTIVSLILVVLSVCTFFTKTRKGRIFNTVINALLMIVMTFKCVITESYVLAGIFGVLLILDVIFLTFIANDDTNLNDSVNVLFERKK